MRGLLLLTVGLAACESTEPRPLMWRIDAGREPSYLFGTLHAGLSPDEMPASVWKRVAGAAVVVTEADVRDIPGDSFAALVRLPATESLRQEVSTTDWQTIIHSLARLYPPDEIEHTQPWFLHSLLVRSLVPDSPEMDTTFVAYADAHAMPLGFFESWQFQMQRLNALGLRDGLKVLLEVARDEETAENILADWFAAYRAANVSRLHELTLAPELILDRPGYYESIVFERTESWRVPTETWADDGGAFVAVGFVHLLGDHGLVSLLRRDGYAVTPFETE